VINDKSPGNVGHLGCVGLFSCHFTVYYRYVWQSKKF